MFAKIDVNGDDAAELYNWLKAQHPGDGASSDIQWNFEKFLVNSDGEVVARFSPRVNPEEITEQIPTLLNGPPC